MRGMTLQVEGLRWHGPISVVGTPSHSYGYGVVAPPRSWDRGIRNAAHPPFPITLLERHSTTKSAGRGYPGRRFVLMAFAGPKPSVARAEPPAWRQLCAGQIVRNALLAYDGVGQCTDSLDRGLDRLTSLQIPRA